MRALIGGGRRCGEPDPTLVRCSEVERPRDHGGRRPVLEIAPSVRAHHEQPDRRKVLHAVGPVPKPAVEPADLLVGDAYDVHRRPHAEAPAREGPRVDAVRPRTDDQSRTGPPDAHGSLALEREVGQGAGQEDVMPAADVESGREGRARSELGGDRCPRVVPVRVCAPVVIPRRQRADQSFGLRVEAVIERLKAVQGVVDTLDQVRRGGSVGHPPGRHVQAEREGPPQAEAELERAAAVDPAVAVVGRGDDGRERTERGRVLGRRQPLGGPDVRRADHPDAPRRPRLPGGPADRLDAVGGLIPERIELPARIESPADVLDDHGIALADEPESLEELVAERHAAAVRGPHQQRRHRVRAVGAVHIREQGRPVAHRHGHADLGQDAHVDAPAAGPVMSGSIRPTPTRDGRMRLRRSG